MTHPLVDQFRFTRNEFLRGLKGVSPEEAARHFGQMNCISWTVGHLAWHEQRYWLQFAQGHIPFPRLNDLYAYGAPMSTPNLEEMLEIREKVASESDSFLDALTTETLQEPLLRDGKDVGQSKGSALRRITYHYWYHTGEIQAIRQMLNHTDLPEYVGDIETEAPYRPE
jgi:uncharacterized damage-inducible protein DinB